MRRHGNSGQVLIITSLIVVLLLLSTAIYTRDLKNRIPLYQPESSAIFSAIRVGAAHTIVSALANITNGGTHSILVQDLDEYQLALSTQLSNAIVTMNYILKDDPPYTEGVFISWGNEGIGISSICTSFSVNHSSLAAERYSEFEVNITSKLTVQSHYTLNGTAASANVTLMLMNEGTPTLPNNLAVMYKMEDLTAPGEWRIPSNPSILDFGNGTQLISFSTQAQPQNGNMAVSVQVVDLRGVFIMANATCTRV